MITVSWLVLSAGVLSVGPTVALATRCLPARAWICTVATIVVRIFAPISDERLQVDQPACFLHCQPAPLPPCTMVIPAGRFSVTVVALAVAAVPVLVIHIWYL